MIQRIQSIYLLLAAIFCFIALFAPLPYAHSGEQPMSFSGEFALMIITGLVALVSLINIFLFRNRLLQVNICKLTSLLTLVLIGVAVYFTIAHTATPDVPHYGAIFPALVFLANWLAMRGVKSDEALVRSADRLR